MLVLYLLVVVVAGGEGAERTRRPNILFIMADDLGYNDVSWHNKEIQTPVLESLARDGIILEQHYAQQVCTPSRAALLTGKYPFHIGRQKRALKPLQPTGLSINYTTLPQQLKNLGYRTHMTGKWHLGYCSVEYTPTYRGFDTFLGFYLGSENYFTHDRDYKTNGSDPPSTTFYDFRRNEKPVHKDFENIYSTTVFRDRTLEILDSVNEAKELNAYQNYDPFFIYLSFQATHAPLQARSETLKKIPSTTNPARDIYKAMVLDLDAAVGEVVSKLKEYDLYNDTIIVFSTDNGGAISHGASNWPLRGTKGTLFEGGTRAVSFLHAPSLLEKSGYVSTRLLHITDWMPTLLKLAGYAGDPAADLQLDGVDQWEALSMDNTDARTEMVYNIKADPVSGAIRIGDYKLLFGKKFSKQGWYDVDSTALQCSRLRKNKKLKRKLSTDSAGGKKLKKKKKGSKKNDLEEENEKNRRTSRKLKKNHDLKLKRREEKKKTKAEKKETKAEKKETKAEKKENKKQDKKITKIWKDWLPVIKPEAEGLIRYRMEDCNWEDFEDSGHHDDTALNPRSLLYSAADRSMVGIYGSAPNPFNITGEDEEREFEEENAHKSSISHPAERRLSWSLERQMEGLDFALYNVKEDPQERVDLKLQLPDKYQLLRSRALYHLGNLAPEDFPEQDYSGHPRNFGGVFSPGWCTPK